MGGSGACWPRGLAHLFKNSIAKNGQKCKQKGRGSKGSVYAVIADRNGLLKKKHGYRMKTTGFVVIKGFIKIWSPQKEAGEAISYLRLNDLFFVQNGLVSIAESVSPGQKFPSMHQSIPNFRNAALHFLHFVC